MLILLFGCFGKTLKIFSYAIKLKILINFDNLDNCEKLI